jgi:hypothetical protein
VQHNVGGELARRRALRQSGRLTGLDATTSLATHHEHETNLVEQVWVSHVFAGDGWLAWPSTREIAFGDCNPRGRLYQRLKHSALPPGRSPTISTGRTELVGLPGIK